MIAWRAGAPVDEDELLAVVGPGLAVGPDAAPLPASAWGDFGFRLGARLLGAWSEAEGGGRLLETLKLAVAAVGAAGALLEDDGGQLEVMRIQATLGPAWLMGGSSGPGLDAVLLIERIFLWGTRRVRRDRRCPDALADLAGAAVEVHASVAALLGRDPARARLEEQAAQLGDAIAILRGSRAQSEGRSQKSRG